MPRQVALLAVARAGSPPECCLAWIGAGAARAGWLLLPGECISPRRYR
jgi:hypothetical protein